MPELLGALHGKYATPHMGVWVLVGVSAIIGAVGVLNVTALTGITLASNIGTFVLYALICGLTFVTFVGRTEFHRLKHAFVPILGLLGNVGLLVAVVLIGLTTGGVSTDATLMALWITVGWGVVSVVYLVLNSRKQKRPIIPGDGVRTRGHHQLTAACTGSSYAVSMREGRWSGPLPVLCSAGSFMTSPEIPDIEAFGLSDVGRVREDNQDSIRMCRRRTTSPAGRAPVRHRRRDGRLCARRRR